MPLKPIAPDELHREGKVFFVGDINSFHLGEKPAGMIKRNFCAHLLGRFDYPAPSYIIERAYAAGVDILDIPLHVFDQALSGERRQKELWQTSFHEHRLGMRHRRDRHIPWGRQGAAGGGDAQGKHRH